MKPTYLKLGLALAALCGLAQLSMADDPATQAKRNRTDPTGLNRATGAGTARNAGSLDEHFAACLTLENQNEVAAAQLAQQRSKSPKVKEFASMLEKDHQQFLGQLAKHGGSQFQSRRLSTSRDGQPREDRTDAPRTAKATERSTNEQAAGERRSDAKRNTNTTDGRAAAGDRQEDASADTLLQIKHEIADECLASMQRELSGKEGREFDACFIGMQLAAHGHMIDQLKVLERHASSELQDTLRKGRETAQKHLDRAKEIMKYIDKGETKTATAK